MSLLRIFLEGDHGKQTYEDPTKPMTYQQLPMPILHGNCYGYAPSGDELVT